MLCVESHDEDDACGHEGEVECAPAANSTARSRSRSPPSVTLLDVLQQGMATGHDGGIQYSGMMEMVIDKT